MTEQQAGQQWYIWESITGRRQFDEHGVGYVVISERGTNRTVAHALHEEDADRIIADHNALQVAVEALEKIDAMRHERYGAGIGPLWSMGVHEALSWAADRAKTSLDKIAALQSIKEQGR